MTQQSIDVLNWVELLDDHGPDISPDKAKEFLSTCPDKSLREAAWLAGIVASGVNPARQLAA